MGRPDRRSPDELAERALPCGRRDDGCGKRLTIAERWQEAGDRSGDERLAGSRRADEQEPVAAGEADFQRAPGFELAPDLGKVRAGEPARHALAAGIALDCPGRR